MFCARQRYATRHTRLNTVGSISLLKTWPRHTSASLCTSGGIWAWRLVVIHESGAG